MAVAISVGAIAGEVGKEGGAALELGMAGSNTSINHI